VSTLSIAIGPVSKDPIVPSHWPILLVTAALLLTCLSPCVPVDALPDILIIGEGETLVIDEDIFMSVWLIDVIGTMMIDGADFQCHDGGRPIGDTYINVSGTLRIVNGSSFSGSYSIEVRPGGAVGHRRMRLGDRSGRGRNE